MILRIPPSAQLRATALARSRVVGPAGLEPATTESQVADAPLVTQPDPRANSTSASTVAPVAELAALVRHALAAGLPLPRDLRVDIARLLVDGAGSGNP